MKPVTIGKPCPFCGSGDWVALCNEDCTPPLRWYVECQDCDAMVFGFDSREDAIAGWNKRASDALELTFDQLAHVLRRWDEKLYQSLSYSQLSDLAKRLRLELSVKEDGE